jgi:hypothetical protein
MRARAMVWEVHACESSWAKVVATLGWIVELLVAATCQSIEASDSRRDRNSHIVATSFGIEHCHWVRSEDPGFVALAVDCLQTCGRRS